MECAMYLRKSRADEASENIQSTLRRHKEALLLLAERNGYEVLQIYEEVVTGDSLFMRPQMLKLLSDVQDGLYEAVLCMDIDRLGRGDMKDQGLILEAFKLSGTKIATPEKLYDLENELDEELTEFKSFLSRRELKMITKRLRRGLTQTISEGAYVANAPYGYEKAVIEKKPTLRIAEQEADFVRMIFESYVHEGQGCTAIASTLNVLGAKPRRSDSFSRAAVERILKNPVYTGQIVWNRTRHLRKGKGGSDTHRTQKNSENTWITADGLHPPIIDQALFEKAQRILKSRARAPSNRSGHLANPLAGLVRCGFCGRIMQVHETRGRYRYLKCLEPGCNCACANLDYVEACVLQALEETMKRAVIRTADSDIPADNRQIHALRALSQAQAVRARLFDLLEQGVYSADIFRERLATCEQTIEQRKAVLTELAAPKAAAADLPEQIDAYALYLRADARQKNELLKSMVEKILYRKEPGALPAEFSLEVFSY